MNTYYTGEQCNHGHISERNVKRGYCCECKTIAQKSYITENKETIRKYNSAWKKNNKDIVNKAARLYKKNNKEKIKEQRDIYLKKTISKEAREKLLARNRAWRKNDWERYYTDTMYRCSKICRNIIDRTIRASKLNKDSKTFDLLGYTAEDFKSHIERQFVKGMSWENHGDWHVDHIYPISKLIDDGITDPIIINALTNLKPIWKSENLSKGSTIQTLL